MTDPTLLATFGKPFKYQVAAFRLRLADLRPTAKWTDLWQAEHDRAFMVAGAVKADILADLAAMVDKAITQGTGLDAFRKDFRKMVAEKGWQISPAGQGTKGGEAWRTRLIYRTNMSTSYAAGRMAQLVAANHRFWVYRHGASLEPRLQHLAWDGLILPPDHPFWATHAPPNGWGCSCYIVGARSMAAAKILGGKPDLKLPDNWQSLDPKTGAPKGIDKGWAYAPGASVARTLEKMAEKTVHWPYEIAKAFMASVPAKLQDDLAEAYRGLASTEDAVRRYAAAVLAEGGAAAPSGTSRLDEYLTLGLLTSRDVAQLRDLTGKDMAGFDFALPRSSILHVIKRHGEGGTEVLRGQRPVAVADFADLLAVLTAPDEVVGSGDEVVYVKRVAKGEIRAVFKRLAKRRMFSLVTFWIVK